MCVSCNQSDVIFVLTGLVRRADVICGITDVLEATTRCKLPSPHTIIIIIIIIIILYHTISYYIILYHTISYYIILYHAISYTISIINAHMDTAHIDFLSAPVRPHTNWHQPEQFFAGSKESKVLGVLDLLCLLADVQLLLFPAMLQLFETCICAQDSGSNRTQQHQLSCVSRIQNLSEWQPS